MSLKQLDSELHRTRQEVVMEEFEFKLRERIVLERVAERRGPETMA